MLERAKQEQHHRRIISAKLKRQSIDRDEQQTKQNLVVQKI